MDDSGVSVLWYKRSKPQGKVRRRVQDLRIPSPSCYDYIASRPALDLSHNESARLAVDSLLNQGLEAYHAVLNADREVDFLSELEKTYILENGRDGKTADPGASDDDDDDKDLESLSYDSQSTTQCPAESTDSNPTSGLELSSRKDVKRTDLVPDEPNVVVYFQSDIRAAAMKDMVREFIRKARMALAIVIDSFTDVELLFDLLEVSKKRNVSVYLLLDDLNLNLFISMWQDLKLNSKNFPKLSVRSVAGQTYCAKTGMKLTGQISESFIITDWTEVLAGSYSFSWLSWQVHRSLAVLVKGSAVTPFYQEFLRLHSSSKTVPGFVTFITVPHTLPLYDALQTAQNSNTNASYSKSHLTKTICNRTQNEDAQNTQAKETLRVLSSPQSAGWECSSGNIEPLHRADTGTLVQPPQQQTKTQPQMLQNVPVGKPKHTVGAVCTQHGAQMRVKPLEKNQNKIQSHSNPLGQTHVSYVQSQLTSCITIPTTAEKNARAQESHPASPTKGQHRIVNYQSTFKKYLAHHSVDTEGLLFCQMNRHRLTEPSGIAAGLNTQRRPWNYSFHFKPTVDFLSDNPKVLSPSTSQQKQAKMDMQIPLAPPRGHTTGLQTRVSPMGTRRQDQPPRPHQPSLQKQPATEAPRTKSALSATLAHLKPQHQSDSKLLFSGTHLQPHTSQQARPPPRLNWMPQSRAERPKPVARQTSFDTTYGTRQKMGGQVGSRPFHSSMHTSLGRSKSLTDRHSARLNPNICKT